MLAGDGDGSGEPISSRQTQRDLSRTHVVKVARFVGSAVRAADVSGSADPSREIEVRWHVRRESTRVRHLEILVARQPYRKSVVLQTSPPHPQIHPLDADGWNVARHHSGQASWVGGGPVWNGAADSFGMKQCPCGCPISGIAVLVDGRVCIDRWRRMPTLVGPVLEVGKGTLGFQDFEGGFAGQDECLNSVRLPPREWHARHLGEGAHCHGMIAAPAGVMRACGRSCLAGAGRCHGS